MENDELISLLFFPVAALIGVAWALWTKAFMSCKRNGHRVGWGTTGSKTNCTNCGKTVYRHEPKDYHSPHEWKITKPKK